MIRRLARTDLTKRAADVLAYSGRPGTSTDFAQLMAGGHVIYRMRIYDTVSENLQLFHEFFRTYLMPVQLRHGARLVGRWEADDGRVIAVWEYDDRAAYEQTDAAVRADPDSSIAAQRRAELPPLIKATDESS